LAQSMAPQLPIKIIGIRPGEKLHEIMCPADDSHLTIEFHDHFVICPSVSFYSEKDDYLKNKLGEVGKYVEQSFEYNSGSNHSFLTNKDIIKYNMNTI